jgi:hypothetical protein
MKMLRLILLVSDKVHLLYGPGYVIPCVGNRTGKVLCKYDLILHQRMNIGSMLKLESSNFLMMT